MAAKLFTFEVEDLRSHATAGFAVEAEKLEAAFAGGAPQLAALAGAGPLRLFRFAFANGRTGERSAFLGQGETLAAAWADGVKGARTTAARRDGRAGVSVILLGGRAAVRSLESFEGDETFEVERLRVRLEKARKAEAAAKLANAARFSLQSAQRAQSKAA